MSLGSAAVLFVFGALAGVLGWRQTTKPIYRRSLFEPDVPAGMTRAEYERRLRRRRKAWRLFITVLYALLGAVAGLVLVSLIGRR